MPIATEDVSGSFTLQGDSSAPGRFDMPAFHLQTPSGRTLDKNYWGSVYCANDRQLCNADASLAPHALPGVHDYDQLFLTSDSVGYEGPHTAPTGLKWNLHNYNHDGFGIYRSSTTIPDGFDIVAYVNFHATRDDAIGGPPAATLIKPQDGSTYWTGQPVDSLYDCTDYSGSGLASCAGPVASGAPIDTSTAGTHTFTVTATDGNGDTTSATHTYNVVDDNQPPTVTITSPAEGVNVSQGQDVNLWYGCDDTGVSYSPRVTSRRRATTTSIDTSTVGAAHRHRDRDRQRGQHDDGDAALHRGAAEPADDVHRRRRCDADAGRPDLRRADHDLARAGLDRLVHAAAASVELLRRHALLRHHGAPSPVDDRRHLRPEGTRGELYCDDTTRACRASAFLDASNVDPNLDNVSLNGFTARTERAPARRQPRQPDRLRLVAGEPIDPERRRPDHEQQPAPRSA